MSIDKRNLIVNISNNSNKKVIYLMTKSFRIQNNYSLYQSYLMAENNGLKLYIYIVEPFEENSRNLDYFYRYSDDLYKHLHLFTENIKIIKRDKPVESFLKDSHTVFIDKSYLRFDFNYLLKIKEYVYKNNISLTEVESNVFVPIREASDKEEYAARTIRKKINSRLKYFNEEVLKDYSMTLAEKEALDVLNDFIDNKLSNYNQHNDPSKKLTSGLSPYLKYGFISPVTIYNLMKDIRDDNVEDFLEELIVRRELAYNYVYYNQSYEKFDYMTDSWAYLTMKHHLSDQREYLYTRDDYINFRTHDPYFNAAMIEMVYLGKMHSYMRMYWCKKIIEWSKTYKDAYYLAIELNNYYFYDGLTPNGYTGVAWCFGKHDRAWFERDIFGKLRYMNDNGLKRKFDIDLYVEQMNKIKKEKLK